MSGKADSVLLRRIGDVINECIAKVSVRDSRNAYSPNKDKLLTLVTMLINTQFAKVGVGLFRGMADAKILSNEDETLMDAWDTLIECIESDIPLTQFHELLKLTNTYDPDGRKRNDAWNRAIDVLTSNLSLDSIHKLVDLIEEYPPKGNQRQRLATKILSKLKVPCRLENSEARLLEYRIEASLSSDSAKGISLLKNAIKTNPLPFSPAKLRELILAANRLHEHQHRPILQLSPERTLRIRLKPMYCLRKKIGQSM